VKERRLTANTDISIFCPLTQQQRVVDKESGKRFSMPQFVSRLSIGLAVALLVAGPVIMPTPAAAAPTSAADKAAQKKATADCRAQVKEKAKYEEMSWYARHRAIKNCVRQTLAGRH
jgi:hypothetical protein